MEKEIKVTPLYFDRALQNDYQVVVQVGGRFSGKSHNEQVRLVSNLASKENYKLLVIEDLETGMADGFHAGLRDRIEEFEQTEAYNPRSRTAHIKNEINNNQVLFRGYATDQQRLNVKKLSGITEILVEEGEWMDYNSFIGLLQQLRGGNKEDRKLTILMNPVNPQCFVNQMLIVTPPQKVFEYFPGTNRPKVFERHITTKFEMEGKEVERTINILVIISTHYDNPFLTLDQRASIEQLRESEPELYKQLGEAKFVMPTGTYFDIGNIEKQLELNTKPLWRGYFDYRYVNHVIVDSSIEFVEDKDGYIKIYNDPKTGYPYVLSGDTAGEGSDWNTGIVTDNTTGAEVATIRVNFDEDLYARQMYCLGKWFGNLNSCNGNALIAIEINHSTHPNKEILRMGYDNVYIREKSPDSISGVLEKKYGFRTTGYVGGGGTRPVMLSMLRTIVREQPQLIKDTDLLLEMTTFVKNDKGKPVAANGYHDDMIMARAINCYCANQQEVTVITKTIKVKSLPQELQDDSQLKEDGEYMEW